VVLPWKGADIQVQESGWGYLWGATSQPATSRVSTLCLWRTVQPAVRWNRPTVTGRDTKEQKTLWPLASPCVKGELLPSPEKGHRPHIPPYGSPHPVFSVKLPNF
jgi:hypothetical protein